MGVHGCASKKIPGKHRPVRSAYDLPAAPPGAWLFTSNPGSLPYSGIKAHARARDRMMSATVVPCAGALVVH